MKTAIVILNWNGRDMMRKYLPSVVECSDMDNVEVIVADNGSDDNSVNMLKQEFPSVKIIQFEQNYGFAAGYNKALRFIDADLYVLLNSDVEIKRKQWIKPIIDFMKDNPDVAAAQPKIKAINNPDCFEYAGAAGGFIDKFGYPFCRGRIMATVEKDNGQYDDIVDVMWATGAALVVRKEDYWSVGGLDEQFFAHMEEIDLCWRIRNKGRRIVCVPQTEVYHLGGASLNQGNPRKTYLNFRNNLIMLYKNLDDNSIKHVLKVRFWLDYIAASSFLLKGDIQNFKAVRKARKDFKKLIPSLQQIRKDIQQGREGLKNNVIGCFSILWQYYAKRHKTFNQLPV